MLEDGRRHKGSNGGKGHRLAKGQKHKMAKLSERDVLDIRRRRAEGDREIDLATEYQVAPEHIRAIVRGKYWKHLPI